MKKLTDIQLELKVPKNNHNDFGKYNYRSCEDILEAVKPLLKKYNCGLYISDDIVFVGNRFYVQAVAYFTDYESKESIRISGFAREPESKKGFDESQITGSSSTYARKYALNGLFAIDDTKDSDFINNKSSQENLPSNKMNDLKAELQNLLGSKQVPDKMIDRIMEIESSNSMTIQKITEIIKALKSLPDLDDLEVT